METLGLKARNKAMVVVVPLRMENVIIFVCVCVSVCVCVLPACEERGLCFYSDLLDQSGETEFLSLEGARHLGEP